MFRALNHTAVYGVAVAMGIAIGCAGRSKAVKSPEECMRDCDQESCQYQADGLGDNDAYLECLRTCEDKCSG